MKQKLINAEALSDEMYRKSFLVDDGRNKWDSGLWIRYKIFEEAIRDAPAVDAIPMDWIEKWEEKNPYAELGDMLNDWKDESQEGTCSGN